jgi:hypothetical protein
VEGAMSAGGSSTGATCTGGGPAGASSPTAAFKVIKPTMGEILQADKDAFVAVVGKKPNFGWTARESPWTPTRSTPTNTSLLRLQQAERDKPDVRKGRKQRFWKEPPTYPLSSTARIATSLRMGWTPLPTLLTRPTTLG